MRMVSQNSVEISTSCVAAGMRKRDPLQPWHCSCTPVYAAAIIGPCWDRATSTKASNALET
jgi:hypothetical protein